MTTTTATTHAPSGDAEPDIPLPTQDSTWKKDFLFGGILLAIGAIAFGVLYFSALPDDVNQYLYINRFVFWTIAVLSSVVMVWPLFLLIKQVARRGEHVPVLVINVGVRLLVIIISVCYAWFWMMPSLRASGNEEGDFYAQAIWNLPRIGGGWMLVASIVFHCAAAYFLSQHKAPNLVLAVDKKKLPFYEKRVEAAQQEYNAAVEVHDAHEQTIKDMQPELEQLTNANDEAVTNLKEAKKVFDAHPEVVELAKVDSSLKANEQQRSDQSLALAQCKAEIPTAVPLDDSSTGTSGVDRNANALHNEKVREHAELNLQLVELQKERGRLEARAIELKAIINAKKAEDGSGEDGPQAIYDAVAKLSSKAAEELSDANEKIELATKELNKVELELATAGNKLKLATVKRDDTALRIQSAIDSSKHSLRDSLVWVFLAIVALAVAFNVADPAWYGFKLIA